MALPDMIASLKAAQSTVAATAGSAVDIEYSPDGPDADGAPTDSWAVIAAGVPCTIAPIKNYVYAEVVNQQQRARVRYTVEFSTPVALGLSHRLRVIGSSPPRYLYVLATAYETTWVVTAEEYPAGDPSAGGVVPDPDAVDAGPVGPITPVPSPSSVPTYTIAAGTYLATDGTAVPFAGGTAPALPGDGTSYVWLDTHGNLFVTQ